MKHLKLVIVIWLTFIALAYSQDNSQKESLSIQQEEDENLRRNSFGSSLWMLYDKVSSESAGFYQLSYGYQFTAKDNIIIEGITWKYDEPLGTYDYSKEKYPGKIRAYGIGLGYQRFHWKNLFTTVEATPFMQQYYNNDGEKIQKGFQLYLQFILGYRFEFFNKSIYLEPAWALKYWPVNSNVPESFAKIARGTNNYIFEPSLNFGYRF